VHTDIGEIDFLPHLMALLAQQAPGITVSTVRASTVDLQEEMEAVRVEVREASGDRAAGGRHQPVLACAV